MGNGEWDLIYITSRVDQVSLLGARDNKSPDEACVLDARAHLRAGLLVQRRLTSRQVWASALALDVGSRGWGRVESGSATHRDDNR